MEDANALMRPAESTVPDYLRQEAPDSIDSVDYVMPRLVLCQAQTQAVTEDNASAGDWITTEPVRVVTGNSVSILAYSRTWRMYDSDDRDAEVVWEIADDATARNLEECQWHGDQPPAAALCYTFVLWLDTVGLCKLTLSRSAVKAAQAVLSTCASFGNVPRWAAVFTLSATRKKNAKGTYFVPAFNFTGRWVSQQLAQQFQQAKPLIDAAMTPAARKPAAKESGGSAAANPAPPQDVPF